MNRIRNSNQERIVKREKEEVLEKELEYKATQTFNTKWDLNKRLSSNSTSS